jgi:hypothetical protein
MREDCFTRSFFTHKFSSGDKEISNNDYVALLLQKTSASPISFNIFFVRRVFVPEREKEMASG